MSGISLSAMGRPEPEQLHFFSTGDYEIRLTLEFYDQYTNGLQFQERSSGRHFCLSAQGNEDRNCVSDFKGAIAVARYKISSHVKPKTSPALREHVRSIDQSDNLPVRPPFDRVIEVQDGFASDIQVFGYQGASGQATSADSDNVWCFLRQDLYLTNKNAPFLVIHWKHTLNSIRILDIIPENGTLQIAGRRNK